MTKRRPSPDEAALWRKATRDVNPLSKSDRAPAPHSQESSKLAPLKAGRLGPIRKSDLLGSASRADMRPLGGPAKQTGSAASGPASAAAPATVSGDPGRDRLVARGKMPIERTLDLHGLTQAAAEPRVYHFIETAWREGRRCVLVITGKGAPAAVSPPSGSPLGRRRGVLRERLLDWVENPQIRSKIARVAPARQQDGGAGAFYIFLKRNAM